MAPQTFSFNGKEQQLWSQTQLEQLGRNALKQRAMDIRDLAGAANLPFMPRHPDDMIPWILKAQAAMSGAASAASPAERPASRADAPQEAPQRGNRQQRPASRADSQQEAPQQGYRQQRPPQYEDDRCSNAPSEAPSEAMSAFNDAKQQRLAAVQRARGSNIFGGA